MTGNTIFGRLCVGTANFGKEYNGAKVSEDDQKRILDYCQCSGIDTIDTATAYEWDWTKVSSYFNVIVKVSDKSEIVSLIGKDRVSCIMAHNGKFFDSVYCKYSDSIRLTTKTGVSVYEVTEPNNLAEAYADIIQIPYSIYDRRFGDYIKYIKYEKTSIEIHVRSIFLRGKILKEFSPQQCISFCLMNPYIDKVIIGADSFEQFKSNLRPFHDMNVAEKHDINLLDPRKWK